MLPKISRSSGYQLLSRLYISRQLARRATRFRSSRREEKVTLGRTHFVSSHSLLPLASPRYTRYTYLPEEHHGTMASVYQRRSVCIWMELTPSPSITSTSFGWVVPFLESGIVRPSRCVIVRSKPSNASYQRRLLLPSLSSIPSAVLFTLRFNLDRSPQLIVSPVIPIPLLDRMRN